MEKHGLALARPEIRVQIARQNAVNVRIAGHNPLRFSAVGGKRYGAENDGSAEEFHFLDFDACSLAN